MNRNSYKKKIVKSKMWVVSLSIWLFFNVCQSLLQAEEESRPLIISPHFTIQNYFPIDGIDYIYDPDARIVEKDEQGVSTVTPIEKKVSFKPTHLAAVGLTLQKGCFFSTVSLAAPWHDNFSSFMPLLDVRAGVQLKKLFLYGGFFALLKKGLEDDIATPLYAGLSYIRPFKKASAECGFQFLQAKYSEIPGTDPQNPSERHTYYTYDFYTKLSYNMGKWIHPFMVLSFETNSVARDFNLKIGFGLTIGKSLSPRRVTPHMTSHTFQKLTPYEVSPQPLIRKPNIYLYPPKPQRVRVTVEPSGAITTAIPEYKNGWDVMAFPDGSISGTPGYLFYEARVNIEAPRNGWCVPASECMPFLKGILERYGFNKREIDDFIEYWQQYLNQSPYYIIHPLLYDELQHRCPLTITPGPDRILRVWFIFKPGQTKITLEEPQLKPFKREGFVATEWGGTIIDQ
jgi:hypothetical protein